MFIEAPATSLAEVYKTSNYYAAFSYEHRSGGTYGVTMIDAVLGTGTFIAPAVPKVILVGWLRPTRAFEADYGEDWRAHPVRPPT